MLLTLTNVTLFSQCRTKASAVIGSQATGVRAERGM